jgi:hypothetical protein
MVPIGTDTVSKAKIATLERKKKEVEKIFNDTHPPPQKRWRPKAIEINQMAMKTENETTTSQLSVGTVDRPAIKAGPSGCKGRTVRL